MSKETQNTELSTDKALHIADVGRSLFNKIRDRVDELYEQMEKEIPFTQPYNNLSERKGKLLQTLRILEREGLL